MRRLRRHVKDDDYNLYVTAVIAKRPQDGKFCERDG